MKLLVGPLAILAAFCALWAGVPFETIQLWIAVVTLAASAVFIVAYLPERPWRHWFGASLAYIAVAVAGYSLSVVLYRLLGPDYAARPYIVTASVALTFTAMVMRTAVLLGAQRRDRRR